MPTGFVLVGLKNNNNNNKRMFFASCNTLLSNCNGQTELVRLSLVESYCLPILQYCYAAYKLSVV